MALTGSCAATTSTRHGSGNHGALACTPDVVAFSDSILSISKNKSLDLGLGNLKGWGPLGGLVLVALRPDVGRTLPIC